MQRIVFAARAAALFILVSSSALAGDFWTGNKLVAHLREFQKAERGSHDVDWESSGLFVGYVLGVYDSDHALCAAGQVSLGQISAVVAKYLDDHPADWDKPASSLVRSALRRAFPCK